MNKKIKIIAICLLIYCIYLFETGLAFAQKGLLDDRTYVGQFSENHKDNFKKEKLVFLKGRFHSAYYAERGFGDGAYTTKTEMDKIYFAAEIENSEKDKISWEGFAVGNRIVVTFQWLTKAWLSDTIKNYSFHGNLKE
jgi:hypothetical protein